MKPDEVFVHADAAVREVIDKIDPAELSAAAPKEWSQPGSPKLRGR
ncbi:hypothetical protein [Microbacterium sp. RURRCA19A]|nr:hypothetical protein [Microbacterium sp. RURRCA19A]SIR95516.1 hypothetical protein SAMN05880568_2011 [Microbacterium sp. RURRCA19A]